MTGSLRLPHLVAAATTVVGLIVFLMPAPDGVSAGVMRTAGVIVFIVGLWATAVLPEYLTSIIFFTLARVVRSRPARGRLLGVSFERGVDRVWRTRHRCRRAVGGSGVRASHGEFRDGFPDPIRRFLLESSC